MSQHPIPLLAIFNCMVNFYFIRWFKALYIPSLLFVSVTKVAYLFTSSGALPIAMALGAGAKSRTGMGIVVVGGVMFSLVLTLYVIPVMYIYLSKPKKHEHG